MTRPYTPVIPQDVGELMDRLAWMMLNVPRFPGNELSVLWPARTLAWTMFELREGLGKIRNKLGEERYFAALSMTDQMELLYKENPEGDGEGTRQARGIIIEMETLIKAAARRKKN